MCNAKKKYVFGAYGKSKDPDNPAKQHNLIKTFVGSPEQCWRRAIVLPLALAAAALASTNVKVFVKVFKTYYFLTLSPIWFIFGMMIHIGPKFCAVPSSHPPPPSHSCLGQGDSHVKIFMLKFYVKVFRTSLLLNKIMDLIYLYLISWSRSQT